MSFSLQQTRAPISGGAGTTPGVVVAPPEPEQIERSKTPAAARCGHANTRYYDLTTPQGFVLERANEVDDRLGFPLEPDLAFDLGDRAGPGERLEDWLPPAGEKIPAQLRATD